MSYSAWYFSSEHLSFLPVLFNACICQHFPKCCKMQELESAGSVLFIILRNETSLKYATVKGRADLRLSIFPTDVLAQCWFLLQVANWVDVPEIRQVRSAYLWRGSIKGFLIAWVLAQHVPDSTGFNQRCEAQLSQRFVKNLALHFFCTEHLISSWVFCAYLCSGL